MKTFCPNCEKETECEHTAELYECNECGEDFAQYIVSRKPSNSDVSVTEDVLTDIKTPQPAENCEVHEFHFTEALRNVAKSRPADVSSIGVSILIDHVEELEAENKSIRHILSLWKKDEVASLRERNFILYSHVEALNRALDSLCPLVARTIDWLPSEQFTLRARTREELDNVTYIQNKEYRETNLDYYKNEPDFEGMSIEKINQYLREHGHDPEKVGVRGKVLTESLTKNIIARDIIQRFLDDPHGCRFCDYGVLRKPGIPGKEHDEDCLYLAARAYLDNEISTEVTC